LLLDQVFPPWYICIPTQIPEFLVNPLLNNFDILMHSWFQFVSYATLRDTLLLSMGLLLLREPVVTFVVEAIIPPGIASIMIRVRTTLLRIPHGHLILCNHSLYSILHIRLHLHRTRKYNNPLCKLCSSILHIRLPLHRTRKYNNPLMQAMHIVIHSTSPSSCSSGSSQVWLTDSGATNHMTVDLANLSLASPYLTTKTIHTVNGEGLTLSHIGHSTLHSSISPIKLNFVLCVPQITQNLLSVHRLCLDNNCRLIFDALCFWIQDKATWRILYKGLCSNGLYPLHSFSPSTSQQTYQATPFLGQLVQSTLWHHRLGHPTNNIVSLMLNKAHVHVFKPTIPIMCHPCLKGKLSKLPFP